MMNFLFFIFYLLFMVSAIYLEKRRLKVGSQFDLLTVVKIMFLINLVFPPIGMYFFLDDVNLSLSNVFLNNVFVSAQPADHLYTLLLTIISYCFICIGYSTFSKKNRSPVMVYSDSKIELRYFLVWFFGFIILVVSIFGFLSAFGGDIISNISISGRYRTGEIQLSGGGVTVFYFLLTIIIPISLFPAFYFSRGSVSNSFWLILEIILVVVVAVVVGSRRLILVWIFLKFLLMAAVAKNNKVKMIPLILAVIVSFIVILNGKMFLYLLGVDDGSLNSVDLSGDNKLSDNIFNTLGDVGISFVESLGMLTLYKGDFRFGVDSVLTIISIIPDKMLSLIGLDVPDRFVRYTTYLLSGDPKQSDIPPGFIGYMWVNLGFIGVVVQSFIYGFVGAFFSHLIRWLKSDKSGIFLYIMFSYYWSVILNSGNWEYWFGDNVVAISWCILLFIFLSRSNRLPILRAR